MARCDCYADEKRGVPRFDLDVCREMQGLGRCDASVCAPWEVQAVEPRRTISAGAFSNVEGQARIHVFSRQAIVREGRVGQQLLNRSERYFESSASVTHVTIANGTRTDAFEAALEAAPSRPCGLRGHDGATTSGSWLEVARTNEDQFAFLHWNQSATQLQYRRFGFREGQGYYGCWFLHAPGSGIFLCSGRTHLAGGHKQATIDIASDPGLPEEDLIGAYLATVNLSHSAVPKRKHSMLSPTGFVQRPPSLLAASTSSAPAPLSPRVLAALAHYDDHSQGASSTLKEHFPLFAFLLGIETVQIRIRSVTKMSEVVATCEACMVPLRPLRTCPPVLLRTGWRQSYECPCDDNNPTLNCDALRSHLEPAEAVSATESTVATTRTPVAPTPVEMEPSLGSRAEPSSFDRCSCFQICDHGQVSHAISHLQDGPMWAAYKTKVVSLPVSKFRMLWNFRPLPISPCKQGRASANSSYLANVHGAQQDLIYLHRPNETPLKPLCAPERCASWYTESPFLRSRNLLCVDYHYGHPGRWAWIRWVEVGDDKFTLKDNDMVEVVRRRKAEEGVGGYGVWYHITSGSGMFLNVRRVLSGTRHDVCGMLSKHEPNRNHVAENFMTGGSPCYLSTVNSLGYDTVHFIDGPCGSELIAVDDMSLWNGSNSGCGQREVFKGDGSPCPCDTVFSFLNCRKSRETPPLAISTSQVRESSTPKAPPPSVRPWELPSVLPDDDAVERRVAWPSLANALEPPRLLDGAVWDEALLPNVTSCASPVLLPVQLFQTHPTARTVMTHVPYRFLPKPRTRHLFEARLRVQDLKATTMSSYTPVERASEGCATDANDTTTRRHHNGILSRGAWPPRCRAPFLRAGPSPWWGGGYTNVELNAPWKAPRFELEQDAVNIGTGRQLFVDDFLTASAEGVHRVCTRTAPTPPPQL